MTAEALLQLAREVVEAEQHLTELRLRWNAATGPATVPARLPAGDASTAAGKLLQCFQPGQVVFVKQLKDQLRSMKKGTFNSALDRLKKQGAIEMTKRGVYRLKEQHNA